ncbi:MAG: hypothetical protein CUN51_06870 [Candidatus Thermofonsia Clade 1 bacterium]|uniref:SH3b domain-containing protein n=1 Tax=Candidatus Thermofonsia Clade 1 bacterium TaxID=2364210 RepID=A0A2M8NZH0_9CHLR|nr:MAG: hypothetical protein CUN51_06870 [Candidatus Thermofonsia Clade 1 bacterium]
MPPDLAAQATFFAEQTRRATEQLPAAYQQTLEANLTHIAQIFTATAWTATPTASATFTPSPTYTLTFTPTRTPTPHFSPTPSADPNQVFLVVLAPSLNVRRGPDTRYEVLGVLNRDERIQLIGTNNDYSWFAFTYRNRTAWITGDERLVGVSGDKTRLPILAAPPLPTATPLPPQPTQAPPPPQPPPSGGESGATPPPPTPTNTPHPPHYSVTSVVY